MKIQLILLSTLFVMATTSCSGQTKEGNARFDSYKNIELSPDRLDDELWTSFIDRMAIVVSESYFFGRDGSFQYRHSYSGGGYYIDILEGSYIYHPEEKRIDILLNYAESYSNGSRVKSSDELIDVDYIRIDTLSDSIVNFTCIGKDGKISDQIRSRFFSSESTIFQRKHLHNLLYIPKSDMFSEIKSIEIQRGRQGEFVKIDEKDFPLILAVLRSARLEVDFRDNIVDYISPVGDYWLDFTDADGNKMYPVEVSKYRKTAIATSNQIFELEQYSQIADDFYELLELLPDKIR